jgi:3-deoxy-manno-octulosonate cytidylyltransferase (CMP-KDO synthetase)
MKFVAVIPARYAATRFPGKLMQMLGNKSIIRHVYDNTVAAGLFDDVLVATDSEIIFDEIIQHGGKAVMSRKEHDSGSDRIAEAVAMLDADVVVNVQGDEPFISKEPLEKLVQLFDDPSVQVASLMRKISEQEAQNPHNVKVVTDKHNNALYFSRSTIPHRRDAGVAANYFLHAGVYAYRKEMLLLFTTWPHSALEETEKLEQLRFLENGVKIRMAETAYINVAIDTPEDLERAMTML